ncbi:PLP-dependent aminotransferase family protein [Phyllobacterium endophyticum]|uniref:GntR family transcriptional regulator n=1 Tax=Phyllobacterium endophyticum TaxID=1149773 RepID=A0A2P7AUE8_9HYPH|nr:PLP-dependent aminotransferase family protein [Phyllobacterium endophyticum]MBB3234302.1 DNA-binding transcriptional MocR family regulator [Phyllobacterium endophyticum]PSH57835.1 GntR family transcriptional regulator [Phyllobacterium endophyticum]TYR44041.1 PLP-dependent aminotransferase family protein [Phyllobacterium endophyticum]
MDDGLIGGSGTLVSRVANDIRQRIAARTLAPGARLPSIRSFAKTMAASKSTIVEAYDRLVAEGVIQSRRGSGFYVAGRMPPLALAEIEPRPDRAIDPLWVSRSSLDASDGMAKPGCGWLPSSWMPEAGIRRALRALARRQDNSLTDYASPLGLKPLRQLLARRMAEHGVEVMPDQIMLTESGTQAVDLLCRFLIEPGDAVMVDDPCYFNFHALLKAHRAKIIGVPYTRNGPDPELFGKILSQHRPRLYITNSALHNPTGAVLSSVVAHRLLKLAEQHDLTIIEDDIFADFEHQPAPRLAAFDGLDRVIHIGSFSKSLSASIRCGFVATRREWIDGLVDLRIATSFGSGRIGSEVVLSMLKDGTYRKHMDSLRTRLARSMGDTIARLKPLGIVPWIQPRGGMFLWCKLPDGVDAARIAQLGLEEGIVFAPGNVFSQAQAAHSYMRFNVAQCNNPHIFEVLGRLVADQAASASS